MYFLTRPTVIMLSGEYDKFPWLLHIWIKSIAICFCFFVLVPSTKWKLWIRYIAKPVPTPAFHESLLSLCTFGVAVCQCNLLSPCFDENYSLCRSKWNNIQKWKQKLINACFSPYPTFGRMMTIWRLMTMERLFWKVFEGMIFWTFWVA